MLIIIDNYDSFTYNLVHYFQELKQKVLVFRNNDKTVSQIIKLHPKHLIISPGPSDPKNSGICLDLLKENSLLDNPIPVLGVCLGHQAIGESFGANIIKSGKPIHGKVSEIFHENDLIFKGTSNPFNATRYHSLIIEKKTIPKSLKIISHTKDGTIMGIKHNKLPFYGLQFHPESIATQYGHVLLDNFLKIYK